MNASEFQVPRVHGSLSSWDDYPVHQNADTVRHVGTSDRNFYDRYYFNCYDTEGSALLIFGLGQYPNLAVQDAFACVVQGSSHRVVRGSRELGDRMDTSVGPLRVEVIKPLEQLRIICEPNEWGVELDLTWNASMPAYEEPRQYIRKHGRVLFDTIRFAQTGRWEGTISVDGNELHVTPDRWWGTRDRSWGVRPVGEHEPAGIRTEGQMTGMWNYAPMQFEDHSILYMVNEHVDGTRAIEEAMRIWHDPARQPEWLGRPDHDAVVTPGTRAIESSTLSFPDAPGGGFSVAVSPLMNCWLFHGTGYGIEEDWRAGMYQGPLVVQGVSVDYERDRDTLFGLVDQVAQFTHSDGHVGYGLHEYFFIDSFPKYGLHSWDPAPSIES